MNRQRAQAYGRVMKTLRDLGQAKLLPDEQELIRDAADTLVFCVDLGAGAPGRTALGAMSALHDHLVSSGRWSPERASQLLDDVWSCGPDAQLAVAAAA